MNDGRANRGALPCRPWQRNGRLSARDRGRFPGTKVLGLENSEDGVELAAKAEPRACVMQRELMRPQTPADEDRGWASLATCSEVLEHVDQARVQRARVPGPGCAGRDHGAPRIVVFRLLRQTRLSRYTEASLRETLQAEGFEVVDVWWSAFSSFNLLRISAILRGKSLINDVTGLAFGIGLPARLAMKLFGILFRRNLTSMPWGGQFVAVAVKDADK